MKRYFWTVSYVFMVLAMPVTASTTRIYVDNNAGDSVTVIDAATNKVIQTIEGIPKPHGITFSPDGSRAYVPSETAGAVFVVDTKAGKIIKKVPLSRGTANVPAVTKDGKRLFVCINGPRDKNGLMIGGSLGAVDIVDTTSLEKVKSIPMLMRHDCYTTPDGKHVIAGGSRSAVVIDVQTELPIWEIHFDRTVLPIAMETGRDGSTSRLFVELGGFRGFAVVDFVARKEVARIKLPNKPSGFTLAPPLERRNITPVHGSAISPDRTLLAIASRGSNAVFLYSLPELKLLGQVAAPTVEGAQYPENGGDPGWLTFAPDSKTIYVANAAINSVSAIDVKTMKEVARIPVGKQPDHVEVLVMPDGEGTK